MYLISIYFDEASEKRICSYMKQIGKATGRIRKLESQWFLHFNEG